jgi:hypothetical protein
VNDAGSTGQLKVYGFFTYTRSEHVEDHHLQRDHGFSMYTRSELVGKEEIKAGRDGFSMYTRSELDCVWEIYSRMRPLHTHTE